MDTAATKLLESATIKTLHAHSFSRSSSQSLHALTDLLARYFALLSETSAKYAHHAGRTTLTPHDALAALDEVGVGLDELQEYCAVEAKELNRYAQHSARRAEDLNEFKAQLAAGLSQDREDTILLEYQRYDSPPESQSDNDEENADMEDLCEEHKIFRSPSPQESKSPLTRTPPLPLSPISNPSSPRKRARTANWKPPSHVPAFLPPFPSSAEPLPSSIPSSPKTLAEMQPTELMPPPPPPPIPTGIDKPALAPPVTQAMTASATSDYFDQVPYNQSSLSSVPEWHLPTLPSSSSSRRTPKTMPALPTLQTEPVLFKAYHHILTHRPSASPPPSTLSRHKVAMAFLSQTQKLPRWDSADTLFSTVAPCPPRVAVIGPSFPVAINDRDSAVNGKLDTAKDREFRFPPTIPRPVSGMERLTPLLGHQSNRIPELARHVLPPVVMNRITRLAHPPVLHRGTKPLLYGRGIPAPWNSHAVPSNTTDGNGIPPTPVSTIASSSLSLKNKSKDHDSENGGESGNSGEGNDKPLIPDAQLFATWDFETKDFKVPVPSQMHAHLAGSVMLGSASRLHRGKVREAGSVGAGAGAEVGVGVASGSGNSMISLPVSAGGRSKSGLRP